MTQEIRAIRRLATLCTLAASCAAATAANAQQDATPLNLLPVQGNVYMLHAGDAGNVAVQIGKDGVVVVNALRAGLAGRIAAAVKTLTNAPIRYIVSTSADLHNTAGNAELAPLGAFGSTNAAARPGATLVAHENVLLRLTKLTRASKNPFPEAAVPQDVYILPFKDLYFNGEPIFVIHEASAHSDAARMRGDSFDADRISMVMQYQCRPHSSDYGMRGLGNIRVTKKIDPQNQRLLAFETYMPAWGSVRTIWLDGRPHPSAYAEHTFQGFSTGVWNGNQLTITTTHLKENYHRRNEVPSSDLRTVTEHWMRHGDILTVVSVVDDPAFFTEPLVRSQNWFIDPGQQVPQFYCEYVTELPPVTQDSVPHHLPGENTNLTEMAGWYGLPAAVMRGGADKMYPEYRKKIPAPESPPPLICERFCNCSGFLGCL